MQINLLPHQWDAVNSTHENTGLIGGVGLGKTYCGSAWIMKKYEEDSLDLITANTYGQLINATLASVFKNLDQWGVPFDFNQQRKILTINKRKRFLCLSLDSYDQHRGIEVGNWWADEAAYNDYDAFLTMKGRLRDKGGKLQTLITTTPKGFNWVYDYFHPSGEKHDPKRYKLITASSFTNKHLPSGYLDSLKSEYDDKLVEQELMGLFVNLTAGKVYYAFSREDNFNLMPTFNPHVTDRVNNVNRLLVKKRMIISPKCVKLINDLEKVSWKGSDLDGTSDKLLTHISDCAGYAAWRLFPIKQDYTNVGPSSSRR